MDRDKLYRTSNKLHRTSNKLDRTSTSRALFSWTGISYTGRSAFTTLFSRYTLEKTQANNTLALGLGCLVDNRQKYNQIQAIHGLLCLNVNRHRYTYNKFPPMCCCQSPEIFKQ